MKRVLVILIIMLVIVGVGYPVLKIVTKKRVIVIINNSQPASFIAYASTLSDKNNDQRINAIFLGVPGEGNRAPNLTDTLMIISADTNDKQGFLLSIPRDLLVKIPGTRSYTKINNLYQSNDINSVQAVLEEMTGLSFDYNMVIDLQGVKKAIDQVGGIDIFIEKEIYDPAFPSSNNSYQLFTLKKGKQHLDGETALKYIRTRYDPTGDFARMTRQQQVLMALKEKASSLHPLWQSATILSLWKTLTGHLQTNLNLENIKSFWQTANTINLENIEFKVLDPSTGLVVSDYTILGGQKAYVLRPTAGFDNYSEIREYINNLINP